MSNPNWDRLLDTRVEYWVVSLVGENWESFSDKRTAKRVARQRTESDGFRYRVVRAETRLMEFVR